MQRIVVYAVFIVAVVLIGSLIGISNIPGPWYQALAKPTFNPPNWIFGPVWTALYVMIGFVGARTWLAAPRSTAMTLWWAQMGLNFLWSPAFFGLQNPLLGLIVIFPLLIVILALIRVRWWQDRFSALMFLPYALWVGFASLLNMAIVTLN